MYALELELPNCGAATVIAPSGLLLSIVDYAAPLATILGIPAVGAVAALVVPVRKRWLIAPFILLAIGLWLPIWFGDDSDYYDIGRDGALILDGIFGLVSIGLWTGGVSVGRLIRRRRARRRTPEQFAKPS